MRLLDGVFVHLSEEVYVKEVCERLCISVESFGMLYLKISIEISGFTAAEQNQYISLPNLSICYRDTKSKFH